MGNFETQTDWFTSSDGANRFYRKIVQEKERFRVVVSHGLGEHSGRYGHVIDTLGPMGATLWMLDHQGHLRRLRQIVCQATTNLGANETAEIARYGYAVEYDFCPPDQLWPSLETRQVAGLFFAGQVHLAERTNARGDCCLDFVDITRVGTLCQVLHFEGDNEDAEGDGGEYADHQ